MTRIAVALLLLPTAVAAQEPRLEIGGASASLRVHTNIGATREALSGTILAGEGRLTLWRLVLDVGYAQGRVTPDTAGPMSRDVVEGRLLLGTRPWRGLAIKAGPHVRAFVSSAGTQRFLFFEARLRGERPIVGATVHGYAELWRVVSGTVNVVEQFDGGQGGEAGMIVRLPRAPLWARLAYGIERAKLGGGSRLETVEGLTVAIGYGRR